MYRLRFPCKWNCRNIFAENSVWRSYVSLSRILETLQTICAIHFKSVHCPSLWQAPVLISFSSQLPCPRYKLFQPNRFGKDCVVRAYEPMRDSSTYSLFPGPSMYVQPGSERVLLADQIADQCGMYIVFRPHRGKCSLRRSSSTISIIRI